MTGDYQSWGNYPNLPQTGHRAFFRSELGALFDKLNAGQSTFLPYGSGRSYGDVCLASSGQVLTMRGLDRFIATDWTSGRIVVEAGVTLGEVLQQCVPRGWFLAVTPGTQFVTVGGAVANDVHGKNHHVRGTFGCHVTKFGLLRSDQGRLECSPTKHRELFGATIGGLGLTGVIEWVEIQLLSILSSRLDTVSQRFEDIDEFYHLSAHLDQEYEYSVAWVDCTARGRHVGRGIYSAGRFADSGELRFSRPTRKTFPFFPPFSLVNRYSVMAFNELYWHMGPQNRSRRRLDYAQFFYPLDNVQATNRVYGRNGFQQFQVLIPESDAPDGIRALLLEIASSRTGSFLAVLKRFGDAESPGWLSFPRAGTTLAVDFPQCDDLVADLFPRLDAIVRELEGRFYPAKDAHMSGADFRREYPRWVQLEAQRDPALLSSFWERVTQ